MKAFTFGDYRLLENLAQFPTRTAWLAEQISVGRKVYLIELTNLELRDAFLDDVRAQASIDYPSIGSVYEAVSEDDLCFAVFELLPGRTLEARAAEGAHLQPVEIARILRRLAEAMIYLKSKAVATQPITLRAIHFDEFGVFRFENILRAGAEVSDQQDSDIRNLGSDLKPLVKAGAEGSSRVQTVLTWMRGENPDKHLSWEEVHRYFEKIESQLTNSATVGLNSTRLTQRRWNWQRWAAVATGLLVLTILSITLVSYLNSQKAAQLPPPLTIPAGEHPSPNGEINRLPTFRLSAHEVTIREYRGFLESLENMNRAEQAVFDQEGQPAGKTNHVPTDWDGLLAAANGNSLWNGLEVELDCPVVNVDWWDAAAFCNWKGARLPTDEEWYAALHAEATDPTTLKAAGWGPVTKVAAADRTAGNLLGMAGSVSEWTRLSKRLPANPLGAPVPLAVGGSYRLPDAGALTRRWLEDRLQRKDDLGFRIVLPAE